MPVPDTRTGILFVWIASCFMLICLILGGTLLALFLFKPESETTNWYPVAGLVFLSLPFVFWSITYAYIIVSRSLGFRLGSSGMGKSGSPSEAAAAAASGTVDNHNTIMDVVVDNDDIKTSNESEKAITLSVAS